jgi:signal transduction histidine kinase
MRLWNPERFTSYNHRTGPVISGDVSGRSTRVPSTAWLPSHSPPPRWPSLLAGLASKMPFRGTDVLGTALVLLQTLPLAVRRIAPLGVLVVISAAIAAHAAAGYETVQAGTFSSLVAVYGATSLTDERRSFLAAGITAAAIAVFFATNRGDFGAVDTAATSGTWAMAWFLGTYVRIRGEQAEAVGERAASLERDHDIRAREAVANERARMARELHDIVGHALNVIVIQAGGAQRAFESKPQVARDALVSIESAGREALFDMERMLGVLRAAEGDHPALGPQPGLRQLDSLAAQVTEAGLPVEVIVEGSQPELPASVDLSAYRIVQEALTNSLKHSRASRAKVAIRYRPDSLEVEVTDDGRGSPEGGTATHEGGRGLLGMRERVALFGGELSVGPAPMGGYRVQARLPFKSAAG